MRNAIGVGALAALVALVACGGSDGAQGPAGPAGGSGGSGGDGGPPPAHAPAGVTFEDDDYAQGSIAGTISVQKASDESDVGSYAVYWGSSPTDKLDLTPIFEVKTTGQDISFPYEGLVPAGATTLLAFAKNPNGESATPVATTGSVDHYLVQVDVTDADAGAAGLAPAIALDTKNQKVVLALSSGLTGSLGLVICNYDGTGCTQKDASAGQGVAAAIAPSIAVDTTNDKIHIAASDSANGDHLMYYTCDLSGNGCTATDISAATAQGAIEYPNIAIDPPTNQLWIVGQDDGSSQEPAVFHCALDATGCAHHVYAGYGVNSGHAPSVVVDVPGNMLYLGAYSTAGDNVVVQCAADGTACIADGFADAFTPLAATSIAADVASKRLYYMSRTVAGSDVLTVCDLVTIPAYNSCTPQELFAGDRADVESQFTSVAFDPVHKRVLVAVADAEDGYRGTLHRCSADASDCKKSALSSVVAGAIHPQIAVDPATGQFFIAAENRGGQVEGNPAASLIFLK